MQWLIEYVWFHEAENSKQKERHGKMSDVQVEPGQALQNEPMYYTNVLQWLSSEGYPPCFWICKCTFYSNLFFGTNGWALLANGLHHLEQKSFYMSLTHGSNLALSSLTDCSQWFGHRTKENEREKVFCDSKNYPKICWLWPFSLTNTWLTHLFWIQYDNIKGLLSATLSTDSE